MDQLKKETSKNTDDEKRQNILSISIAPAAYMYQPIKTV